MNDQVQLSEDMVRLEVALFCLERVAPESINPDVHKAWRDRARFIKGLKDWHQHARKRLQNEYLKT